VRADLGDATVGEYDDQVGRGHRREAVGHQHGDGAVSTGPTSGVGVPLEQGVLGRRVERRRGLVEHEQQRTSAHHAAGDRQPLPLAAGELGAVVPAGAELRAEAGRQGRQHVRGRRVGEGLVRAGVGVQRRQVAGRDRLAGDELEVDVVLERAGAPQPPRIAVEGRQVHPVDQHLPGRGPVQPGEQLDQRGLAGAVLADHRDDRAGRQVQRHVLQRGRRRAGIGEPQAPQGDPVHEP
jgi:hypothetical protein